MHKNIVKLANSLIFKITFSFTIVLLGCLLSLGFYVRYIANVESQNLQNEYNAIKVKRIENLINSISLDPNSNLNAVQRKLMDYSQISGTFITLYDQNNKKIFDSSKGFYYNKSISNPIFQVIPTRNGNMVVEIDLKATSNASNSVLAIQSLSVTDSESNQLLIDPPITNIVTQIIKSLTVIGLLALITSVFITWMISKTTLTPLISVIDRSKRLSRGDFSNRITVNAQGEVGELIDAFNYMADELESIDKQRKIMIADIAHELRTPLTNLKGYIEGWSDGVIKPNNETLEILNLQVVNLSTLIDDLSTLSLAESGMLKMDISEFNLYFEINNIVNLFKPRFYDNDITVINKIGKTVAIKYDLQRFTQIITNLLNNSLLAMDENKGSISFESDIKSNKVYLTITDTGKGISSDNLPHIFERFYRVDNSRDRKSGGSGLGLSIVKNLIESHSGKINITSEINKGTSVIIEIK